MRLAAASQLRRHVRRGPRPGPRRARAIYAEVADKYYRQLAACFDDAADKFTAVPGHPPDSLPAQIIDQNRKS